MSVNIWDSSYEEKAQLKMGLKGTSVALLFVIIFKK